MERLLEGDPEATHLGQWIDLYYNGQEDPTYVLQCVEDFITSWRQQQTLSLPLMIKCYTINTHSRCNSEWWHPVCCFFGLLHHVKIIYATKGSNKEDKKEEIALFYGKETTLGWNMDQWRWVKGLHFFNFTTEFGRESIINRIMGLTNVKDKWHG